MARFLALCCALMSLWLSSVAAQAQNGTFEVTASYRERIALPPSSLLEIQLVQTATEGEVQRTIASQLFKMSGVPMTVVLSYDPAVVGERSSLSISAEIFAPEGALLFRGTETIEADREKEHVDVVLTRAPERESADVDSNIVTDTPWTVTEVFGEAWAYDKQATLVIDGNLAFSLKGACNSFSGEAVRQGRGLAFPGNIAATMMACVGDAEEWDRKLLAAISQVAGQVRYGSGMVMTDQNGRAVLHFTEAHP